MVVRLGGGRASCKAEGRKGVMEVVLIINPDNLSATLPKFKGLLAGYSFQTGQTYAEYRPGEQIRRGRRRIGEVRIRCFISCRRPGRKGNRKWPRQGRCSDGW